jgi:hypothetical protein
VAQLVGPEFKRQYCKKKKCQQLLNSLTVTYEQEGTWDSQEKLELELDVGKVVRSFGKEVGDSRWSTGAYRGRSHDEERCEILRGWSNRFIWGAWALVRRDGAEPQFHERLHIR